MWEQMRFLDACIVVSSDVRWVIAMVVERALLLLHLSEAKQNMYHYSLINIRKPGSSTGLSFGFDLLVRSFRRRPLRLTQRFAPPSSWRVPNPEFLLHLLDILPPSFLPVNRDQTPRASATFQCPGNILREQSFSLHSTQP